MSGKNIHLMRRSAGLTQNQLAESLNVTRQAVTSRENGLPVQTRDKKP